MFTCELVGRAHGEAVELLFRQRRPAGESDIGGAPLDRSQSCSGVAEPETARRRRSSRETRAAARRPTTRGRLGLRTSRIVFELLWNSAIRYGPVAGIERVPTSRAGVSAGTATADGNASLARKSASGSLSRNVTVLPSRSVVMPCERSHGFPAAQRLDPTIPL